MTKTEMKKRTKQFALDVIRLVDRFPHARAANIIGQQLIKAATSNELIAIFTKTLKTARKRK